MEPPSLTSLSQSGAYGVTIGLHVRKVTTPNCKCSSNLPCRVRLKVLWVRDSVLPITSPLNIGEERHNSLPPEG